MSTTAVEQSDFMTVLETARFLGWGRDSVYESCRSGRLPSIKLGRQYRIPRRALIEFLEREAVANASGADTR